MSFGAKDIRNRYPRITENHLRYLEKWGLIRPAPARASASNGEFTFAEVATIKQLSAELERDVPLRQALRLLLAEHQGQLELDFHASGSAPAKVVALRERAAQQREKTKTGTSPAHPTAPARRSSPAPPFRFRIRRPRSPRSTSSRAHGSTTATTARWRTRRRHTARRW